MKKFNCIRRGDIYYASLDPVLGSEQGGIRPVLIIQNDKGNEYSHTVIVACISSKITKSKLPTHVDIAENQKLPLHSMVLLEQIRTIDVCRLIHYKTHLSSELMTKVDRAIMISLGIL